MNNNGKNHSKDPIIESFNSDTNFKSKFNEALSEIGVLLEYETEKRFIKRGFEFKEANYMDKIADGSNVTKQIDILANKRYNFQTFPNVMISPELYFIGDCKYNKERGDRWIVLDLDKRHFPNTPLKIPFFINGDSLNYNTFDSNILATQLSDIFGGCIISRKIEKYYADGPHTKPKENDPEETIYDIADSQIMPAIKFYYERFFLSLERTYKDLKPLTNYFPFNDANLLQTRDTFITSLSGLYLPLYIFLPVIITNRKIILLKKIDENSIVEELESHPFVLYLHAPKNPEKFITLLHDSWEFPVLIINDKHIEEAIDFLERGLNKIFEEIKNNLIKNPLLIVNDIQKYHERLLRYFNLV